MVLAAAGAYPVGELALQSLPLQALHQELGARFAPFAGYAMPVQYEGILAEHAWTRSEAGLFDVSHMGPCFLVAPAGESQEAAAARLEQVVPSDVVNLKPGQQRYTVLLDDDGRVLDDLIIARPRDDGGRFYTVVNAGCKDGDFVRIEAATGLRVERRDDGALLALQGPKAAQALERLVPGVGRLTFMTFDAFPWRGAELVISRSGYTGEDGFEALIPPAQAEAFARALLAQPEVKPIGLGARDTLRLEAGLCLYGHDLTTDTSPIEADLAWVIQKRRRAAADFPGAARILAELADGPARKRVGLVLVDKAPAREGAEIVAEGRSIGRVTSGTVSPTLGRAISMGYVEAAFATPGARVDILVRNQPRPADVVPMPFVPHRYVRG